MLATPILTCLKLLSRPTFGAGAMWSMVTHTLSFAATVVCFMWLSAYDRVAVAPQSQVIEVAAAFASGSPATEHHVDVEIEHRLDDSVEVERRPEIEPFVAIEKTTDIASVEQPQLDVAARVQPSPTFEVAERQSQATPKIEPTSVKSAVQLKRAQRQLAPPTLAASATSSTDRTDADMSDNVAPPYPTDAVRRRLQGTVILELRVLASGDVTDVRIHKSSGHPILDSAALESVRHWHGKPATLLGVAVATTERLPIRFRL